MTENSYFCPQCGAKISTSVRLSKCPNCGAIFDFSSPQTPAPPVPTHIPEYEHPHVLETPFVTRRQRPLGVLIIGILQMIFGTFMTIGGISAMFIATSYPELVLQQQPNFPLELMPVLGAIALGFGGVLLLAGFGLLKLQLWAWIIDIIILLIEIILEIANLILLGLIILPIPLITIFPLIYLIIRRDFFIRRQTTDRRVNELMNQ